MPKICSWSNSIVKHSIPTLLACWFLSFVLNGGNRRLFASACVPGVVDARGSETNLTIFFSSCVVRFFFCKSCVNRLTCLLFFFLAPNRELISCSFFSQQNNSVVSIFLSAIFSYPPRFGVSVSLFKQCFHPFFFGPITCLCRWIFRCCSR